MLSPLRNSTFAHLFVAHSIGLVGNGLATVALALLASKIAGAEAGIVLGTALTLKMVAYIGFGTLGSALVTKFSRQTFLGGLNGIRAIILGTMFFVDHIWQIYVLIFLLSASAALFTPVLQATIPEILHSENEYTKALSLTRLAVDLENLLSPLFAALLLGFMSFNSLFVLAGISLLLSSAAILFAGPLPDRRSAPARGWGVVTSGIKYYLSISELRALLVLCLAASAGGAMVLVNTVVYARDVLGMPEASVAIALAAFGAGSMLAALLLPRLLKTVAERHILLAGGALSVMGLALGLALPPFFLLLGLWFVIGFASSVIQTPAGRLIQRASTPNLQPNLFAAHFALTHACWLVCYPIAGWTAALNFRLAFGVLAGIAAVALVTAAVTWKPSSVPVQTPT